MLKNILNLEGAQQLTKGEQKRISGGNTLLQFEGESGAGHKCCWTGTNNCSVCNLNGGTCQAGATLTPC